MATGAAAETPIFLKFLDKICSFENRELAQLFNKFSKSAISNTPSI